MFNKSAKWAETLEGPALPTVIEQVDAHCDKQIRAFEDYCDGQSITRNDHVQFVTWPAHTTKRLAHLFLEHPDSLMHTLRGRDLERRFGGVYAVSQLMLGVMHHMRRLAPAIFYEGYPEVVDRYPQAVSALAAFARRDPRALEEAIARVGGSSVPQFRCRSSAGFGLG